MVRHGPHSLVVNVAAVFDVLEIAIFFWFEFAGCPLTGVDLDFGAVDVFFMVSDVDDFVSMGFSLGISSARVLLRKISLLTNPPPHRVHDGHRSIPAN